MPPTTTEILFILDRSGSMESIRHAAIAGFNRFLADQLAAPDAARLTLLLFDDRIETHIDALPLPEVLPLDHDRFVPRGSTALLDAIGTGIDDLVSRLAALPADQLPAGVIVAILTDGQENSSRRFTWPQVADRIARQRDSHGWEFFFLGAGPDAIATAAQLQIGAHHSAAFTADAAGIDSAKAVISKKILSSRAMKHGYATEQQREDHLRDTREMLEEEDQKRRQNPNA